MLTSSTQKKRPNTASSSSVERAETPSEKESLPLGAIFGASRSGTTWLGTLISSHPDVAYRFEPFHRLAHIQPDVGQSFKILQSPQLSSEHRSQIYHSLLPAYPEIEKPPFFPKDYQAPLNWGREVTWPFARKMALVGQIFRKLYTPKMADAQTPTLIFKQVEMVYLIAPLLERLGAPVVYLMRHPCAVVWSRIRGQKDSLMPTGRADGLDKILRESFPELVEKYAGKLKTNTEKEALLWRLDVEWALSACSNNPKGLPVFYEELVENTLPVVERVFEHFGLSLTQDTVSFIEDSTHTTNDLRQKRGEIGINPYFSVFRNSRSVCDKWKEEMPAEDRARVMQIVGDSKAFQMAADRELWSA